MTLALEEPRKKAEDTLTMLAAAEAAKKDLEAKLSDTLLKLTASQAEAETLRQTSGVATDIGEQLTKAIAARLAAEQNAKSNLTLAEERAALLKTANAKLAEQQAANAKSAREVALLNQQMKSLRDQLGSLQALLDDAQARDVAAKVQIQSLGSKLNVALAQKAAEEKKRAELEAAQNKKLEEEARRLAQEAASAEQRAKELADYRSEFFGKLKQLLGDQKGIEIVGDRFVFSSEVLFESGSATLSETGKAQITQVAQIMQSVAGEIPKNLDWVLRVDGHTDNVPLNGTGKYANNWELSQGRALSVVTYMIDTLHFPANRLAATGFGDTRPVDTNDTPEGRAHNRRIEFKLTER
jgi:chemotaxis protein MotB